MHPLVSIIMPVYNASAYVGTAIESVLNQSHQNWELLIVNDGSTDKSRDVILQYDDPRIRFYDHSTNRGVSAARNKGLAHMKGEFLCFLDADDVLPSESISGRLAVLLAVPEVNMVDGRVEVFDASMVGLVREWTPSRKGEVVSSLLKLKSDCFLLLSWMIRVLPGVRYSFDEDMRHAEDLLFLAEVARTGNYDYVEFTIYQYRQTPGSAMGNIEALGKGYEQYYRKVLLLFSDRLDLFNRWFLLFKIRRIMFLSFLSHGKISKALKYLLTGWTH
ncbi:MAG: glycosyltransferase family 2 protein [Chryseosolibacter sp.]